MGRIFGTDGVRGLANKFVTAELALDLSVAAAHVLGSLGQFEGHRPRAIVGRDSRASGEFLAAAVSAGLASAGVDVNNVGVLPTPAVAQLAHERGAPAAMITASHNPAKYNGIKLCRRGARPVGADTGLAELREMSASGVPAHDGPPGTVAARDLLPGYAGHLRKLVDLSGIRPLKVAVDAGNGMAGYTVPEVFTGLPLQTVPLYFELDGSFPHHEANPIDPANLRDLQDAVTSSGADIGLAFDGDADRCFVVDERGEIVSPSVLTALIAVRELAREPGATVIHNLITSRAVPEIIAEHGGNPVRTRVGHSFIKAEMAATGAIFARASATVELTSPDAT